MPFIVPIEQVANQFPEYSFVSALTPSAQKAAFHVRDETGKDLCLKIISPDYDIDRLNREINTLQSISHPNVVSLIEYTFSSSPRSQRHFIVEDFIEGSDLSDHISPSQPWSRQKAADFFSLVADGLSALHAKRFVHRDLKPHNIRVRSTAQTPVIIDFGLVRALSQPDITSTRHGAQIGTPLYFSPEQFSGTKRDIDHRTDLFALGTILLEALAGAHPFFRQGMSLIDLENAVSSKSYEKNTTFQNLPQQWQLLIGRLLAPERLHRIQNTKQVITILKKLRDI